jgi:hypothetical protein
MRALLLLLVLLPQDPPPPEQILKDHAAKAMAAEDYEAANVLYSIAAWFAKDEEAAKLERETAQKIVETAAPKRVVTEWAALTDSPYDALVATVPGKTKAARTSKGGMLINFDGERLTFRGGTVSRKRERPGELELQRFFIASDDELVVIDGNSCKAVERKAPGGLGGKLVKSEELRTMIAGGMIWSSKSILHALRRLNDHRRAAGLKPAAFSAALSYGACLHARYLVNEAPANVQGLDAHGEVEGKWRTEEGAASGRRSNISSFNLEASIDQLMATLYHRIPMIAAEVERVGIGQWEKDGRFHSVIDVTGGLGKRAKREPLRYPADGQTKVPRTFAVGETPDPRPQGIKENVGYPITLTGAVKDGAVAELVDDKGAKVECFVSTPAQPANPVRPDNGDSVCILPKKALKGNTKFTVTVKSGDESWTWTFTTRP